MSMKNSNDTIGNRTRDLPTYSAGIVCIQERKILSTFFPVNYLAIIPLFVPLHRYLLVLVLTL